MDERLLRAWQRWDRACDRERWSELELKQVTNIKEDELSRVAQTLGISSTALHVRIVSARHSGLSLVGAITQSMKG